MSYQTAAGATLSAVAAAPAAYTAVGYAALTWVNVGEVTSIGDFFGREYAEVTHSPLATRATKYGKGSYNNGTINPSFALDNADAGQLVLRTALAVDTKISLRIVTQDAKAFYATGLVMAYTPTIGGVDDIVTASATIRIIDDWIAAP